MCNDFFSVFQEIKQKMKREEEELKQRSESSANHSPDHPQNRQRTNLQHAPADHPPGIVGSTMANVLVILGFAAFAWTVKYVLRSIANTED